MCDYSLHLVRTRPAKVDDHLVLTKFRNTLTRGFASIDEPEVAVCLLPGTEVAFEKDVKYDAFSGFFGFFGLFSRKLGARVARFRQVNTHDPYVHHDALEFPDGRIITLQQLEPGQHATVLQLPNQSKPAGAGVPGVADRPSEQREASGSVQPIG